jgi:hypothetical protein
MVLRWLGAVRKRSGSFRAVWGSWRRGQFEARRVGKGCSMASKRRRRAAVVSNGAPAEIRRCLGAGEDEQGWRKLARGSVGTMGGRQWLSTVTRSSPDGRNGRRRQSGVRGAHGKGKRGGNGSSMSCWCC